MAETIARLRRFILPVAISVAVAAATIVLSDNLNSDNSLVILVGGAICFGIIILVLLLTNYPLALNIFLLLIPFQYVDLSAGRVGFYLSPIRLGLPLMIVGWLLYHVRRPTSIAVTALNFRLLFPLIGFLITVVISVVLGKDPATGVESMSRIAEAIVIFIIIIDVVRTKKLLNSTILTISIAVGIVCISLVSQFLTSPDEFFVAASRNNYNVTTREASVLGEPNTAANSVAILYPLLLYSAMFNSTKIVKWILRGLVILTPLGVLLTVSRGGTLGLGIGILTSFRHKLSKILLIFVPIMILIIATPVLDFWLESIQARPASSADRLDIIRVGLQASLVYPVLGTGFGTFTMMPDYVDFSIPYNVYESSGAIIRPAHNLYLEILVETGIISLFFFCFFLWRLLRSLLTLNHRISPVEKKQMWWLTQFMIGCIVAFLITRLFMANFYVLSVWVMFAILVSGCSIISAEVETGIETGLIDNTT